MFDGMFHGMFDGMFHGMFDGMFHGMFDGMFHGMFRCRHVAGRHDDQRQTTSHKRGQDRARSDKGDAGALAAAEAAGKAEVPWTLPCYYSALDLVTAPEAAGKAEVPWTLPCYYSALDLVTAHEAAGKAEVAQP